MRHQGFTLAEMLIALALIGTIAALLIPKLLSNVGNRQDVAKIRSTASTLERVLSVTMSDPDISRNQDFGSLIAQEIQRGVAPATTILDCDPPATPADRVFYMPDGSGIFLTNVTGSMSTNAATATVCIELNTRAGNNDGYSGVLTAQVVNTNSRYFINWSAAPTGGAQQNAAGLLY